MPQPSLVDVVEPFDPTGYASISGAQLSQLVSGLAPYIDKGLAIQTIDVAGVPQVPDANTNTKWQTYVWVRQSISSVGVYVWGLNVASDATFLQWVSITIAGIAAGSVTGTMIATNTITDSNINGVSYSKISGAPANLPPSGAAGGDLTGTYPNPSVAALAITAAKIANNTITGAQVAANSLPMTDITPSGGALQLIRTNAGATAVEWFDPQVATLAPNPANPADNGKALVALNGLYVLGATALVAYSPSITAAFAIGAAGSNTQLTHTAAAIPHGVRTVLVCQAGGDAATNYAAGDEVSIESAAVDSGGDYSEAFTVFVDATQVNCVFNAAGVFGLKKKGTGALTQVSAVGNWKLKAYIIP